MAVDDGSTDRTPRILDEAAALDPRLRVVRQEASGIVAALERARDLARGRFLARMDADDISEPGRFRAQMDLMGEDPDLAAVGARVRYVPRSGVAGGARRYETWINSLVSFREIERDIFVECPLPHPTFFMRAAAVASVGGYRDRGWPEDYDLILRLWRSGYRLGKVPEVLLSWREGSGRLSRTHDRYRPEAFRRCKVHHLQRTLLRERDGAVVWGAGPTGKAFALTLLDRGVTVRAFVDVDPRKVGQEIHGAPVIPPEEVERYRGALSLAAVGQEGAREEIRGALEGAGWVEMKEFVAVA